MKKVVLMMFAMVALVASKANADASMPGDPDGNAVNVILQADVSRDCNLDFAALGDSPVVTKNATVSGAALESNAILALSGETPATVAFDQITVYETCNDDFKLAFRSANGGLGHLDPAGTNGELDRVVPYSIVYSNPADMSAPLLMTSTDIAAADEEVVRNLADFQAVGGQEGSSWYHSPASLDISLTQEHALPIGSYTDVLEIQMSAAN